MYRIAFEHSLKGPVAPDEASGDVAGDSERDGTGLGTFPVAFPFPVQLGSIVLAPGPNLEFERAPRAGVDVSPTLLDRGRGRTARVLRRWLEEFILGLSQFISLAHLSPCSRTLGSLCPLRARNSFYWEW